LSDFQELKLDTSIMKGVEKMGYGRLFPIQERAIGPLLNGKDVIGQAKTGSGKTAAFALPLLQSIDVSLRRVQALVLAPTRELAVQITEEVKKLGAYTPVKVVTIYGGHSINVQREALAHGVHAVIGTPGRIIDHLRQGSLDLSSVKFVVLDEADTMLDMGFLEDVEFILSRTPKMKQMSLFSATMPHRITELAKKYMANPERILVDMDEPSVDSLDQYYAIVNHNEKFEFLVALLQKERPESAIIFCRTKRGAHRLALDLHRRGFQAVPLHGDLSQRQRDHHMDIFRGGHADILVATDVASRGIDVSQVAWVVNHDIPEDPYLYFHRVGRTARAGRPGKAFSLISNEESGDFARILQLTKAPIAPMREQDKWHEFHASRSSGNGWRNRRRGYGRPRRDHGRWQQTRRAGTPRAHSQRHRSY
jgi:ATP-dependent RNA helicase DeaD